MNGARSGERRGLLKRRNVSRAAERIVRGGRGALARLGTHAERASELSACRELELSHRAAHVRRDRGLGDAELGRHELLGPPVDDGGQAQRLGGREGEPSTRSGAATRHEVTTSIARKLIDQRPAPSDELVPEPLGPTGRVSAPHVALQPRERESGRLAQRSAFFWGPGARHDQRRPAASAVRQPTASLRSDDAICFEIVNGERSRALGSGSSMARDRALIRSSMRCLFTSVSLGQRPVHATHRVVLRGQHAHVPARRSVVPGHPTSSNF